MSNLQTYYHFKLDFQKVDQHTGGKWLIHDTKRRKNNQLQSLDYVLRTCHNLIWSTFGIVVYLRTAFKSNIAIVRYDAITVYFSRPMSLIHSPIKIK